MGDIDPIFGHYGCDFRPEKTVRKMRDSIEPCYTENNVSANGATETEFSVWTALKVSKCQALPNN